jgi:hypothetical protein
VAVGGLRLQVAGWAFPVLGPHIGHDRQHCAGGQYMTLPPPPLAPQPTHLGQLRPAHALSRAG